MPLFRRSRPEQKGFTIIEAVVSTAVFAFIVSSALGVYLSVVRLDSKSRSERAVQQNARFIMDYLSKEIRNGTIDYTRINDADTLSLLNQQDQEETIELQGTNLVLTKTGIGSTPLNSTDVQVIRFRLYTTPNIDPFDVTNGVHVQPHTTIVITLTSRNQKFSESAVMNVQSTFTSRDYPAVE